MQIKFENPKMKQSEMPNQAVYSSSTLKRYRIDINMLSPCTFQTNTNNKRSQKVSNTNLDNNSHREHDYKRPQMTSKRTQTSHLKKNKLKGGEDNEINDNYLDEILYIDTL